MGKKTPKAPAAPDPNVTAAAQGSWNSFTAQQQQAMNMVGQNTPWGSLDYSQNGYTTLTSPDGKQVQIPSYTANVNLSPSQQAIFDQTQAAEGNLAQLANSQSEWLKGYLGQQLDLSNLPMLQSQIGGNYSTSLDGLQTSYAGADDFSADRQRTEDAILQRMAPQQAQDADRLRTQLINSGIRPGSPAWDSEMARLSSSVNDARLGAVLASGQEQSRLVGLARDAAGFNNDTRTNQFIAQNQASLGAAGFNNAARGQGLSEALQIRNQPLNELLGVMSGTQVQSPAGTFAQTPQSAVGGVDYSGLVSQKYQADMAQWQQQVQNQQNRMGGLFNLGKSIIGALPFSDRRLKSNIVRVGVLDNGLPVYRYTIDGVTQIGVMAQEVAEVRPEAVAMDEDGFMHVRYDLATEAA